VTLHVVENAGPRARLGITVTRKVGGAVVRNRIRRRLREILRCWSELRTLPPLDIVVHVKPSAPAATFSALQGEVESLLGGLLCASRGR
jgi:ribonuclease P protein component